MSTEELLKRRLIFENDYPESIYSVGETLTLYKDGVFVGDVSGEWLNESDAKKFPYLFREIPWWEDRKEKDMPEYVRISQPLWKTQGVFKVVKYELPFAFVDNPIARHHIENFIPATFIDFENFTNEKN